MEMTPYQMCVNNAANHIKKNPALTDDSIDAFTFSSVLSACFGKDKAEILTDIIVAGQSK